MKFRHIIFFVVFFVATSLCCAQTLGTVTGELLDEVQGQLDALTDPTPSWGQAAARDDLIRLRDASTSLLNGLEGHDAEAIKKEQLELFIAGKRLKASWSLLPVVDEVIYRSIQSEIAAISDRLTSIRNRFDARAARPLLPLSELALVAGPEDPFSLYPNPQALLIDVRDARSLCEELDYTRYPRNELGRISPNNLDPLQVRRMIQKAWELQRSLEGRYDDIYALTKQWKAFKNEYNRMGYPGSSNASRQLERVVTRLERFFNGLNEA